MNEQLEFQHIADLLPVLVWMSDTKKNGIYFNKTWLNFTGRTLSQERGMGWFESVHPDDVLELDACTQAFVSQKPFQTSFRMRNASGQYRWFFDQGVPRFSADGDFLGFIGTCVDVTERKMAEERLENGLCAQTAALTEGARIKDEFLATLSHELRNPLAPIYSGIQLLKMFGTLDERSQQSLGTIERQVHHLTRLVDDLLDMSRISRGKVELKKEVVLLRSVLQRAIDTAQPKIRAGLHHLHFHFPEKEIWLYADAGRLAQVFVSLLNNAAQYTPKGGHISIAAKETESYQVEIRISDNGLGISSEFLPHIFDLFMQAPPSSRTGQQGGLGIGLTIAKKLTQLHRGQLSATSAGPQLGSEFKVTLPTVHHTGDSSSINRLHMAPPTILRNRKILIADDNADAAVLLSKILLQLGSDVRVAYDGVEALQIAAKMQPDIMILDIDMPYLNGHEVAAEVRLQCQISSCKIPVLIALTGWMDLDDLAGQKSYFDYQLTKPVDVEVITELIERAALNAKTEAAGVLTILNNFNQ